MSKPIRTVIVNSRDAAALEQATAKLGWNLFVIEPEDAKEDTEA